MRRLLAVAIGIIAVGTLHVTAGEGKKGEIVGAHLCCGQCVKIAKGVLEKVDGVSDVKVEQKTKTATFTAKDKKAAEAAVKAMYDAGFAGTSKFDGAALEAPVAKQSNSKAAVITVTDVHVCCGQCVKALNKIFDGAKVGIDGSGPQKTLTVEGDNLTPQGVLETLNKTGFNGKIEKK